MNKLPVRLLSLLTACALSAGVTAFAADYAAPLFPLDHPGDGVLNIRATDGITYQLRLVQHSQERENLALYDAAYTLAGGDTLSYPLEAGSYTLYLSCAASADGLAMQTVTQDFVVENADFSGYTLEINETLILDRFGDDQHIAPVHTLTEISESSTLYREEWRTEFAAFSRVRGDFNGDGAVTILDARRTLDMHVMRLTELVPDCSNAQIAVCDFNGNGILDMEDAKTILNYVVLELAYLDPEWES